MRSSTNSDKARAESQFKKERRFRDGQIAAAAYEAEQQAIRQKTARLRALRMAWDAVEDSIRKSETDSEQTQSALAVRATVHGNKEKADV